MFKLLLFLSLCPLIVLAQSPQETKFFNKMNDMLSTYLSLSQYKTMFTKLTDLCLTKDNASEVMSEFVPLLMEVMTPAQKTEVLTKGALVIPKIEGGLTALLGKLSDVMYNNILAFCQQLMDFYKIYKDKGFDRAKMDKKGYGKCNQFATLKRVTTIMCRVAAKFKPAEWTAIKNNFSKMFLFYKYQC